MADSYEPNGISEHDTKTHPVMLNECPVVENGAPEMGVVLSFPHGNGDWHDIRPTLHQFYLVNPDGTENPNFEWAQFDLNGEAINGIWIEGTGYTINRNGNLLTLFNANTSSKRRHEYVVYVRDTRTGKVYALGPGSGEGDGPGGP